ncbi:hypothetical protein ACKS0A_00581 [Histoplasma ohiense]
MLVTRGAVFPRGRNLITVSSSLNMCVFASDFSLATACLARSSFIRAILSSRVMEFRFRGRAIASKTSCSSMLLSGAVRCWSSPFNARSASAGPPSTAVAPPKLNVGDAGDLSRLVGRERRSGFSKVANNEDFPASHSCSIPLRSAPIDW